MDKSLEKIFCARCKKDLSEIEKLEQCECGSRDFIFGKTIIPSDNGFVCSCGSTKLQRVEYIRMPSKFITSFKCVNCGADIGMEVYDDELPGVGKEEQA